MKLFCRHSVYRIIRCDTADRYYFAVCEKCGSQIKFAKAKGEIYEVGMIVHRQEA